MSLETILNKDSFSKSDIVQLLNTDFDDRNTLFKYASEIKKKYVDSKTYFRGLIEYSNVCGKNCLYCGIRRGNKNLTRYTLSDEEIIKSAKFAMDNNYGSIVLQGGEIESEKNTARINNLILKMMEMSDGKLGITLSLGEQSFDTYKLWKDSGAKRYLLRIETSSRKLYKLIHPDDEKHNFDKRVECLKNLKDIGYQVGTGVMVGFPWQTAEDIAGDVLFIKEMDVDMIGLGPYLVHKDTPLYQHREVLLPLEERFILTLKLISILRIMMKDINIAASTAMQSIDKFGREKAIKAGANIIMPNITPGQYRDLYKLYENKPCTDEEAEDCLNCMEVRISIAGDEIGLGSQGDSIHFQKRQKLHLNS
ncbi:MAG: [FeFe] hydrogenase H-cluster radical SAM maturase HydE [Candidatus Kapabacteria bacterium]|nr:[FeFe] hydrogenase H-cluster radical SAM maturase HydE [Candidatus Kapabacteria bacterium]